MLKLTHEQKQGCSGNHEDKKVPCEVWRIFFEVVVVMEKQEWKYQEGQEQQEQNETILGQNEEAQD